MKMFDFVVECLSQLKDLYTFIDLGFWLDTWQGSNFINMFMIFACSSMVFVILNKAWK